MTIPFRTLSFAALCLFAAHGAHCQPDTAPEPIPFEVTTGKNGQRIPKGWQSVPRPPAGFAYKHQAANGAEIWRHSLDKAQVSTALAASVRASGFTSATIVGKKPMQKGYLIDQEGIGYTVLGNATKNGKLYKFAMFLYHGSLQAGEKKSMVVHAFAAPIAVFQASGGWVVPAAFWFGLRPDTEVGNVIRQGRKNDKEQAALMAAIGDVWAEGVHNKRKQSPLGAKTLHSRRVKAISTLDDGAAQ